MSPETIATVEYGGMTIPVFNCGLCGPSMLCPKCGNNACNGGYGEVDGAPCDVCPLTYDAQDANGALLQALSDAQGTPAE